MGGALRMMRSSARILVREKELIIFPALSGVLTFLLAVAFLAPELEGLAGSLGVLPQADSAGTAGGADEPQPTNYVVLALFYVTTAFIVVFFNSALIACAFKRMDGGDPDVFYGLEKAMQQIGRIFAWAVLSGSVGMLLNALEKNAKGAERFVASVLGFAWSVTTYLALPALIAQRLGPFEALRESARLLKETWGEQLAGQLGFGLLYGVVIGAGAIALAIPGVMTSSTVSDAAVWLGVFIVYVILVGIVISALQTIYRAALYRYAGSGEAPEGFDLIDLAASIRSL